MAFVTGLGLDRAAAPKRCDPHLPVSCHKDLGTMILTALEDRKASPTPGLQNESEASLKAQGGSGRVALLLYHREPEVS